MNKYTLAFLPIFYIMSYYFRMITWMKNLNNYEITKVQPQDVAYKSVAYKKKRVIMEVCVYHLSFAVLTL